MTPCSSGNSPTMPVTRSALASRAARSAWSGVGALDDAFLDQPARQLRDPLDLVGDGAELLVEHDPLELLRLLLERHLQVLLPEEARVGQPRGEHAPVALDDRLAAVVGVDVGDADEVRRERPSPSRMTKYFWLVRMVSSITSSRHIEKIGVERAEQRHRPFGQPGILDHQPLVLDQRQAGVLGRLAAPSRMIASRSSWSTITWQARSFST